MRVSFLHRPREAEYLLTWPCLGDVADFENWPRVLIGTPKCQKIHLEKSHEWNEVTLLVSSLFTSIGSRTAILAVHAKTATFIYLQKPGRAKN